MRFPSGPKVPHIGWNEVVPRAGARLFDGIDAGTRFYFVHSYYPEVSDALLVDGGQAAHCHYGLSFPALIARGQLYGTQFHPEKSQTLGLRLISNFLKWRP